MDQYTDNLHQEYTDGLVWIKKNKIHFLVTLTLTGRVPVLTRLGRNGDLSTTAPWFSREFLKNRPLLPASHRWDTGNYSTPVTHNYPRGGDGWHLCFHTNVCTTDTYRSWEPTARTTFRNTDTSAVQYSSKHPKILWSLCIWTKRNVKCPSSASFNAGERQRRLLGAYQHLAVRRTFCMTQYFT